MLENVKTGRSNRVVEDMKEKSLEIKSEHKIKEKERKKSNYSMWKIYQPNFPIEPREIICSRMTWKMIHNRKV